MKHILIFLLITTAILTTSCEQETERRTDYAVEGIDISRYQETINWDTVARQGIAFAFVKATEGRQHVDKLFKTNWAEMRRVRLRRGAYHFFRPAVPPNEQAENFMEWVELKYGDLPPVIDFEVTDELPRDLIVARLRELSRILEIEYGKKPIIYTYYKFYNQYIAGEFDQNPIWIAKYGNTSPRLAANADWKFWQYGNRGRLNGIKGDVDLNVFNGTLVQLDSLCLSGASLSFLNRRY